MGFSTSHPFTHGRPRRNRGRMGRRPLGPPGRPRRTPPGDGRVGGGSTCGPRRRTRTRAPRDTPAAAAHGSQDRAGSPSSPRRAQCDRWAWTRTPKLVISRSGASPVASPPRATEMPLRASWEFHGVRADEGQGCRTRRRVRQYIEDSYHQELRHSYIWEHAEYRPTQCR